VRAQYALLERMLRELIAKRGEESE
jgi:hypothetical protein